MRHATLLGGTAIAMFASILLVPALAQRNATPSTPGPSAAFNPATLPEQEIGQKFTVKAEDLPPPKTGPVVSSRSLIIPYQDQRPRVPDGFTATVFATGLEHPRRLLVLPNGDVILAEQSKGHLTLLRDDDGDGKADWIQRHAEGFNGPYGLAWRDGFVLVADQDGIWQVPHRLGALRPGAGAQNIRVADVPPGERKPTPAIVGERMITKKGVFGIVQGHANRHLAIDPKTGGLFVGVGSSGNIGVEPEVKASIQHFDADGSNQSTFASGLRNATALAFSPTMGDLYTVVQERDGLGDRTRAGLYGTRAAGRVLRVALRLYRSASAAGVCTISARQGQGIGAARPSVRCPFLGHGHRFLRERAIPGRIQGRRVRRIEGLVEPFGTHGLQGRACAIQGRQAARILPELRDRLLGFR